MADQAHTTSRFSDEISSNENRIEARGSRLSDLFRDPTLRSTFRRAERDGGAAFAVPAPKFPRLNGGAAVKPEHSLVLA